MNHNLKYHQSIHLIAVSESINTSHQTVLDRCQCASFDSVIDHNIYSYSFCTKQTWHFSWSEVSITSEEVCQ